MYYDALRALLDQIEVCFTGCEYDTFVSMGIPPAVCNSIAAYFGEAIRSGTDSSECILVTDDTFYITITRCCAESEEFNSAAEEAEAKCFLEDLELLMQCLHCNIAAVMDPFTDDCSPIIDSIIADRVREGGCYSATITISFAQVNCCP